LNNLNLLNEIQFTFYNLQFTFKITDGGSYGGAEKNEEEWR